MNQPTAPNPKPHRRPTFRRYRQALRGLPRDLFKVDLFRLSVVTIRYVWMALILRRVKLVGEIASESSQNSLTHNIKNIGPSASLDRWQRVMWPFLAIDRVRKDAHKLKILIIGPQGENELFATWAHGFSWKNIYALDLFTYTSKISLGDMHSTEHEDSFFDIVMLGWVYGYSDDKTQLANELGRITKSGGIISLTNSFNPKDLSTIVDEMGYSPGSTDRPLSLDDIRETFKDYIAHEYFAQDIVRERPDETWTMGLTFSIK